MTDPLKLMYQCALLTKDAFNQYLKPLWTEILSFALLQQSFIHMNLLQVHNT